MGRPHPNVNLKVVLLDSIMAFGVLLGLIGLVILTCKLTYLLLGG